MRLERQITAVLKRTLARLPQDQARAIYAVLRDPSNIQNAGLWLSAVVAGLCAVAYALAFRYVEAFSRQLITPHENFWAFLIAPAAFLGAWALVRRFAPAAGGSGIPQIMAANESEYDGEDRALVDRLLSPRTMIVKVASSLLCVLGGGAIGREGPTLQISAGIFHLIAGLVRRLGVRVNEQTWITAGAAAGLASAFNTPLGGIVYAIEELGAQHFARVRTALLSAVIVAGVVAQIALGSYLYLGLPTLQNIGFGFLPWAIVTGVVTGLLGATFGHYLFRLARRRQNIPVAWQAAVAVGCGLAVAALARTSEYATGPGLEMMTGLLFRGEVADWSTVVTRLASTSLSYLSGAAGGIFAPSLAIGASAGSLLTGLLGTAHPNLMVLLGMIGFLTGVVRTPFTSFILVVEMTDRHSAIFPMMITALVAQSVAHLVDPHGFYEHMKETFKRPVA